MLWTWLRVRVTERLINLKNKIQAHDMSENRKYAPAAQNKIDTGTTPEYTKRNSLETNRNGEARPSLNSPSLVSALSTDEPIFGSIEERDHRLSSSASR